MIHYQVHVVVRAKYDTLSSPYVVVRGLIDTPNKVVAKYDTLSSPYVVVRGQI